MDGQKFAVDLIAWNIDRAHRWLAEGMVSYAAGCVDDARHYTHELASPAPEMHKRALILLTWTHDLVQNVAHRLAPEARQALELELALAAGGGK